jgi:hypothetical protein
MHAGSGVGERGFLEGAGYWGFDLFYGGFLL